MKQNNNILVGLFFVILGILFLLRNFDLFHFRIEDVFRLWPFALIYIGVRMLPVDDGLRTKLETGVIILFFVALVTLPYLSKKDNHNWYKQDLYNFDDEETSMIDSRIINSYEIGLLKS